MVGIGCCARAASGHATAATPSSLMSLRRVDQSNCIACRKSRAASFDLGAGSFDDWRPFRQLRFYEFGGLLRRSVRCWINAGLLQTIERRRISKCLADGITEPINDRLWRACWGEDYVPGIALETSQSLFL
jgi:hypothetical protein